MFRGKIAVTAAALMVSGCASSIMNGFVGQPIQQAMVKYGSPSNAFDMGDGRRAFQWTMRRNYTAPTLVSNRGSAYPIGNNVWWTQNTTITGGQTSTSECNYTMYGRWNGSAWMIEGFEKPRFMCE